MRENDLKPGQKLINSLMAFDQDKRALRGLKSSIALQVFVEQILDSIHRVNYVPALRTRELSERSIDPNDEMFDPVKAAIVHSNKGNFDEAFWLTFLLTHFGKHRKAGWQYIRDIYGQLGSGKLWDWEHIYKNTGKFRKWLSHNQNYIRERKKPSGFSNHRKYQSLDAYSPKGTGSTIESYVQWIGTTHSHQKLIEMAHQHSEQNPKKAFDYLYKSMNQVIGFGRTGRVDYLTMIGHIGLADIEPGLAYLQDSTGPLVGTKLLFTGNPRSKINAKILEVWLLELDNELEVGMQVLEDSLCNWQKSPDRFIKFRG